MPLIFSIFLLAACNREDLNSTEDSIEEESTEASVDFEYETEIIAEELQAPWEMVIMPDGNFLITEREGRILLLAEGEVLDIVDVQASGEGGLLGMTLSPNFTEDNLIYLYYTYSEDGRIYNRVSQFTFNGESLENETIIVDQIPGSEFHNGGRIKFGPDEKLYITTGDAQAENLSQDMNSLAGKILRVNSDGSIPSDNPFPNSLIFALGLRNTQGLAWHPVTGDLFASDHGPQSRDEINLIEPGGNYGWPEITCDQEDSEYISPVTCYTDFTLAPSGIDFHTRENGEEISLYVAGLRGNQVMRIDLDREGNFIGEESILEEFGRIRTVVQHEEGIYLLTNNTDGRGNPNPGDDKLIKVIIK